MTVPNTGMVDAIRSVTQRAPTLLQYPDLTMAAAGSPDPGTAGQALDYTGQTQAVSQAVDHIQQHHEGLFHHLFGYVEDAAGTVAHVAGQALNASLAPLRDMQRNYRFLHDEWAHASWEDASLATLGAVVGTGVGAFFGGPQGAALGFDLATMAEAHSAQQGWFGDQQKQIYERSKDEKVSFGRDIARLLHLGNTDHGWGKFVSGVGDLGFDFALDPLAIGGKVAAEARSGRQGLAHLPIARQNVAVRNWLLDHGYAGLDTAPIRDREGNILVDAVDRIDSQWNNPRYRRALNNMVGAFNEGGAGKFVSQFPQYARLGTALEANGVKTAKDLHDFFLTTANNTELLTNRYGMLPSQTLLRSALNKTAQGVKEFGGTNLSEENGLVKSVGLAAKGRSVQPLAGAVAGKIRTFTGQMPYNIDRSIVDGKQLLQLSGKNIDLADPGALKDLYRMFRFSMGDKGAQALVSELAVHQAANNTAMLRTAYMNGSKQMLLAAGLPESHRLIQQVMSRVEDTFGRDEVYAVGHESGMEANYVTMRVPGSPTDGAEVVDHTTPAAIWASQATTNATMPEFWKVKNAVRELSGVGRLVGGADEAFAAHYTNGIFKPLALVNSGFGFRIALAEAIPSTFRYGALHMLQGRLLATHAEDKYRLNALGISKEDIRLGKEADAAREAGDLDTMVSKVKALQQTAVGHKLAAMSKATGGVAKLLGASDEDFKLAHELVEAGNGHIVYGVARAGSHTHLEPANAVDKQTSRLWFAANRKAGLVKTDSYTLFQPGHEGYAGEWQTQLAQLQKNASARNIAADLHEAIKNGTSHADAVQQAISNERARMLDPEQYAGEKKTLIRYQHQSPEEFAAYRVDAVRNLLTGSDGTFHSDLAQKVVSQEHISQDELARGLTASPRDVPGLSLAPLIEQGLYSRAINQGFKRAVDPIINHLSREPMWFNAVKQEMAPLMHLVKPGGLTYQEALHEASYRATESILPQIHNVMQRSQFAMLARNFLPFYFAQEQALKRTAHLVARAPQAFDRYLLASNALQNPGFVENVDGKKSIVLPYTGNFGKWILDGAAAMGLPVQGALPLTFMGSTESLKTVLPELNPPGVSPLMSIGLNELAKFMPEWSPEVSAVLGRGAGQRAIWSLIPNQQIRQGLIAWTGDESDRGLSNAMMQSIAAAAAHGQLPAADASPLERKKFLDRIKNNARSIIAMKGIISFVSPLSPTPIAEDVGLRDEFRAMLDKGMSYTDAINAFTKKYGQGAISYTVAKNDSPTGAILPSTSEALQWIDANQDLVGKSLSAAYFVPENGHKEADGFAMYNEAMAMNLLQKETPDQFLTNMYIKQGGQQYWSDKTAQEDYLKTLTDPAQIAASQAAWSQHVKDLKMVNPVWADDFTSGDKNMRAQELYADMQALRQTSNLPASPMTSIITQLMDNYARFAETRATAAYGTKGALDESWDTYLDNYIKETPEAQNVINNVFRRLNRSY